MKVALLKSFIEKTIRLPVLTSALSIFILLLGVFGLMKMPLRFLPKMDQALIEVETYYPGAEAEVVKNFVTSKLQNSIVGVEGIDYVVSSSRTSSSEISIYLSPTTDVDTTFTTILGKISGMQSQLPSGALTPIVSRKNMDDKAIFILGFTSQQIGRSEVAEYLRRVIEPKIEAVDGVSQARVWGDDYAMQIWLNPVSLTAYHLSPQDVVNALRSQNVLASPGVTEGSSFNYTLNTTTALHTVEEFNDLVISVVDNVPVHLKDIGEAKTGAVGDQFRVYYNGLPATMVGVVGLPASNPLTVVKSILQNMPQITKNLPADLKYNPVLDRTRFIRDSLHEVTRTLIESMLIVIAVIFLFLGNIRAAFIPAVTIPLSLVGICFFMAIMGYSINTITLLAMVLGVGLVVDDAIVVVENCVRHLTIQRTAIQSTIMATQELIIPVIAMTITLAAVFMPIGFTGGLIGQLFKEFAFTLAGSVIISGFLALTLSPMMGARLISLNQQHKQLSDLAEKMTGTLQAGYRAMLLWAFHRKKWMIVVWIIISLLSILLYALTPSELTPAENQGFLFASGNAPPNANLTYLDRYAKETSDMYKKFNEIENYAIILSPDRGYMAYLILNQEKNSNKQFILDFKKTLQTKLEKIPGLDLHVNAPGTLSGKGPAMEVVLQSTEDYKYLYATAKKIEAEAMKSGMFMFMFDDLSYSKPQANIVIDPHAASSAHVTMSHIAEALSSMMSRREIQQFSAHDQSYGVIIKTLPEYQLNPEDLQNIPIPTDNKTTVPLSSVASLNYTVVPSALNQFQKMNSVTLMGDVLPGHTVSQGLSVLNKIIQAEAPKNILVDYAGNTRQFLQEGNRMLLIFGLAILVIFLVLSMQFESYRDSLIILLGSVPLALFAALLPLKYGLGSINIYTQIGLLTLVGLICKHGILITRFANELKAEKKLTKQSAVIEAALLRFRPIIMTTAAIVFGAVPLILAAGAGSESRYAIGVVIGFGMSIGTLLTLLLLPVVYTVFARDDTSSMKEQK